MTYYAGLDVSLRSTHSCVIDDDGELLAEGKTDSEVADIIAFLDELDVEITEVGLEAGTLTQYLTYGLQFAGYDVVCMEARQVKAALSAMRNKTDKNDALAVAETANRPNIKIAPMKTLDHQAMQSVQRSRELIIQERTALSNHVRGLLLEFGIAIPKGLVYLRKQVPLILEDAENGLPMSYRPTLHRMLMRFRAAEEDLAFMDEQIKQLVKSNDGCRRLTALEGVGPIGAVLLVATLGSGDAFKNGREFSAYLGLTPKQYSSGGKTNVIGIARHVANRRLRAVLIQGARAYVNKRKQAASNKDEWLLALVARAGAGRAAVALANKNVRTAWAMLTQGTEYKFRPCVGNAA